MRENLEKFADMAGTISQLLKQVRVNAKLSQRRVGQVLGLTQGMISQIESGQQHASKDVAEKIRQLAEKYQPATTPSQKNIELKKQIKTWKHGSFEFSLLEIPYQNQSGDFFVEERGGNKPLMLMGDSFGHGDNASYMAHAMDFGFQCIRKTISSEAIVPSTIIPILKSAYQASESWWAGPPSVMAVQIDLASGDLEVANDGMPYLMVSGKENESPTGDQSRIKVPLGGTVLAFSDGFIDLFEDPTKMQERFWRISKSFKGDAQAIMLNLLKISKIDASGNVTLRDDVTVLVIARSRSSD